MPQERSQLRLVLVVIIAYLIGSIPFGYLIVRAKGGGDVRDTGSGATGATNVSRRAGKAAGVFTLILDALKGAMVVIFARSILDAPNTDWLIAAAAVAVVAGHIFPVWLGFRGGKGVATGAGVFLALAPMAVLFAAVIFVAAVWFTKIVSLGSMSAAVAIPTYLWFQTEFRAPGSYPTAVIAASIVCAWLIIYAHRGNLVRVWNGTEPRISDRKR